jgi:hypothetical protein
LIAAEDADRPLPPTAHFTESLNCAAPAAELACDSRDGYRTLASGVISLSDGSYVLTYDKGSNPAFALPAAQGAPPPTLMFKAIGDGLYIAQLDTGVADAETAAIMPRYIYSLVRIAGPVVSLYKYLCEENGDVAYVRSGQLAAVTSPMGIALCQPASLDGLATVFRARLANGQPPSEQLELTE